MKPMLLAFVAMALICVGASYMLHEMGFAAQDKTSGAAVRLE